MTATIEGRRARLRPPTEADQPFLYALATSPDISYRWIYRGYTPSPEEFVANLNRDVHLMFVVERRETGEPIGLVLSYLADMTNRHARIAVVARPEYVESGRLMGPSALLINHLFEACGMRKVYLESVGFNYDSIRSGEGVYWHEEACLKEHEYFNGRRWDVHVLAIEADEWHAHWARLEPLLVFRPGDDELGSLY